MALVIKLFMRPFAKVPFFSNRTCFHKVQGSVSVQKRWTARHAALLLPLLLVLNVLLLPQPPVLLCRSTSLAKRQHHDSPPG